MQKTMASRTFSAAMKIAMASLLIGVFAMPGAAFANDGLSDEDVPTVELKDQVQGEYRNLLRNAARLRRNAEAARRDYKLSTRRNYPRGEVRKQFLVDAEAAEKELVQVEAEIEKLKTEARGEGAMPGWFYEVEEENFDAPTPASPAEEDAGDRGGRNPLYLDDDD